MKCKKSIRKLSRAYIFQNTALYKLPALTWLKDRPPVGASGFENKELFQVPWDPSLLAAPEETFLGFTPQKKTIILKCQ